MLAELAIVIARARCGYRHERDQVVPELWFVVSASPRWTDRLNRENS